MNDFTPRNPQPCSMAEKGSTTRPKISIVERGGGGMVPYNYAKELTMTAFIRRIILASLNFRPQMELFYQRL